MKIILKWKKKDKNDKKDINNDNDSDIKEENNNKDEDIIMKNNDESSKIYIFLLILRVNFVLYIMQDYYLKKIYNLC